MPLKALSGFLCFLRPSPKQVHEWAPVYLSNLLPELTYRTTLLQTTWSEHVTKTNAFNPHEMSMRYTQVRLTPAHQLVSRRTSIQTQSVSRVRVPLHQIHGWLAALQTCLATTPLKFGFLSCRMCSFLLSPSLSPTGLKGGNQVPFPSKNPSMTTMVQVISSLDLQSTFSWQNSFGTCHLLPSLPITSVCMHMGTFLPNLDIPSWKTGQTRCWQSWKAHQSFRAGPQRGQGRWYDYLFGLLVALLAMYTLCIVIFPDLN